MQLQSIAEKWDCILKIDSTIHLDCQVGITIKVTLL